MRYFWVCEIQDLLLMSKTIFWKFWDAQNWFWHGLYGAFLPLIKTVDFFYIKGSHIFDAPYWFPCCFLLFSDLNLLFLSSSSRYPLALEYPRCLKKKEEISHRSSLQASTSKQPDCASLRMNFLQRPDDFVWL